MTVSYDIEKFNAGLVENGLILPSGVKGIYGRGAMLEDIVQRFNALIDRETKDDGATALAFPPVLPRALIEKLGYLDSFPQLAGSVHSFRGSEAQARDLSRRVQDGERWEHMLEPTDAMLAPAACYPVYPNFSGLLPDQGRLITVTGWVFRHDRRVQRAFAGPQQLWHRRQGTDAGAGAFRN